jgi:hypothetical protein
MSVTVGTPFNSLQSLSFDFYPKSDPKKVLLVLSSELGRRISEDSPASPDPLEHSNLKYKIHPTGKVTVRSGFMKYGEAKILITKFFKLIESTSTTKEDCSFEYSIMFNDYDNAGIPDVSRLDMVKFIVSFDEELAYSNFKERKNTIFSKSIKNIIPGSKFFIENRASLSSRNFNFPFKRYFGVDFDTLKKGNLTYRYIGGSGYEKKLDATIELLNYSIDHLYKCIKAPALTREDETELASLLEVHQKIVNSYSSVKAFRKNFPEVVLLANLIEEERVLDTIYPYVRDRIFNLMSECEIKKGYINYNSDNGKIQLKDAIIEKCYVIDGIDIFDCEITGTIINCDIFSSKIKNAEIFSSNLFDSSKANNCYVYNSYINSSSIITDCTFEGNLAILSGKMENGTLISGKVSEKAKISEGTTVLSYEKIK